ncbi:MAG TPA: ABC transporter permease [Thermoanaerobaculia bacterium]|jgi:phospholipid/cholesterol/gamma-HCH transport system permease protein|nr:ABC transporter permease [Thermoanaerobaculia bacterium]
MAAGSSIARNAGAAVLDSLAEVGSLARLAAAAGRRIGASLLRRERMRVTLALRQTREAGNRSLPLVGLILLLVGMILALQSAYQLRQLGALDLVADLVAISVTRELAPLLTAIVVAGRVGSAIAAELGTMRVNEEIDALVVMGIDPVSYLVVPRLLGLMIAVPCLTVLSDALGIFGGFLVAVFALDLSPLAYLRNSLDALVLEDVWGGLLKALMFSVVLGLVGCERGFSVRGGPEQVGRATTSAVVVSIVLVIVVDLAMTAILYVR